MSLFYRLWVSLALTLGLLMLALGIGEYQTLRRALFSEIDRNLEGRAHWIERELRAGRMPKGPMVPDNRTLEELAMLFVEIYDAEGNLEARSSDLAEQALPGGGLSENGFQTVATPAKHPFRVYQLTLSDGTRIRVGESLQLAGQSLRGSLFKLIVLAGGGLAVAAALCYRALWRICSPLTQLAHKAAEIARVGTVSQRLPLSDHMVGEVRVVSQTINQLLERVEHLLDTQQRLLQDTSHELRNPLAVLQMDLDLLMRSDLDEASRLEVSQEVRGEMSRLVRLVDDLLQISWAETAPKVELRSLDLGPFLRPLLAGYEARREGRSLQLGGASFRVRADERRLDQIVRNVLDNAFRYAGPEANISLWMVGEYSADIELGLPPSTPRGGPGYAYLIVQDDGPGIDPQHWERIFERFYRLERDRNRLMGGTGLGLPVARALARAMDGELWLHSERGRGSSFYLRLKLAP